jgi:hypothetical protein
MILLLHPSSLWRLTLRPIILLHFPHSLFNPCITSLRCDPPVLPLFAMAPATTPYPALFHWVITVYSEEVHSV